MLSGTPMALDKQIINLPATTTTYKTFMENPIEMEKKKSTMRPDFSKARFQSI